MEYRVLSGASAKSLEEQVVDLAKDGFVPQGGVATLHVGSVVYAPPDHERPEPETILFSQAMVKVVR